MVRDGLTASRLKASVSDLLGGDIASALDALLSRAYIVKADAADGSEIYRPADAGRDCALHFLAAAKAHEANVSERFGEDAVAPRKRTEERRVGTACGSQCN